MHGVTISVEPIWGSCKGMRTRVGHDAVCATRSGQVMRIGLILNKDNARLQFLRYFDEHERQAIRDEVERQRHVLGLRTAPGWTSIPNPRKAKAMLKGELGPVETTKIVDLNGKPFVKGTDEQDERIHQTG